MADIFPIRPSLGQLYTSENLNTYRWDGSYWNLYSGPGYLTSGSTSGGSSTFSGGTVTGPTYFSNGVSANTISATTYLNLPSSTFTGGTITNPSYFSNGLSANTFSATTYVNLPISGLTAGSNIGLTNNDGNYTISFTGTTGSNFTGGTVTGATFFSNGLSANTISATTYQNLPIDIRVTGGTFSNGITIFTNNTGGTFTITGFTTPFTGGTVTGATFFSNGLSANTFSATTLFGNGSGLTGTLKYYISGSTPSGTINNGDKWFNSETGVELTYITDADGSQWVQTNGGAGVSNAATGGTYSNGIITLLGTGTLSSITGLTTPFSGGTITGLTVNGNLSVTGLTSSSSFTGNSITLSNSASTISLNNETQQQIRFFSGGIGTPTNNTYSAGAKIIFSDNISSISSGYAIGVDAGSLWYGADLTGNGHDWYAGTRKLASLIGSAGFQLIGLGGPTTTAMVISGTSSLGSKGGTGYTDFLQVINNWSGATNPNKWFRVNQTGGLEILNSVYTAVALSLSDNGILSIGGGNPATTSSNDGQTNYLSFGNNNTQIYDDGNTHIHSRSSGQSMWINTNGGQLNLLTQGTVSGGGIGSGIAIATTTLNGYVTINTGRTITTAAAYGFLTTGGAGTYPGGSQSVSISLYANNRIWGQEIDAFSDERMKNIQGEISLQDGIKLVNSIKPIKYTWKEGDDKGVKVGYSAQQVIKSGFDHLVGLIPTRGLEETIDEDGFLSPKDTQFAMNYDQVTPYHGIVIKYLLEEITSLRKELNEIKKGLNNAD